jgi:hypothetical protein
MAARDSTSSSNGDLSTPRKRRHSGIEEDKLFDNIVKSQFEDNMEILRTKLKGKNGLLTFCLGLLDSGKLEQAYERQMKGCADTAPSFPQSSKYMKTCGVTWAREVLGVLNPLGFMLAPDASEDEGKLYREKLNQKSCEDWVALALHTHKECWLPHRDMSIATAKAHARYDSVGKPLREHQWQDNQKKKGFYTTDVATGNIIAIAMPTFGNSEFLFVPSPCGDLVEWDFEPNTVASSIAVHPDGDRFALLPRFRAKYPALFSAEKVEPVLSLEDDGETAHPSLGDVRRKVTKVKGKGKGNGKCVATLHSPSSGVSLPSVAATAGARSSDEGIGVEEDDLPLGEGDTEAVPPP